MKRKASKGFKSMLRVDFRRMFTQPLLYIMLGTAFVIPILVLVMTDTDSELERRDRKNAVRRTEAKGGYRPCPGQQSGHHSCG